jgi:hypothetical protein
VEDLEGVESSVGKVVKHDSLLHLCRQERPFDLCAGHRRQIRQGGTKGLLPAAFGAAEGDVRMGDEVHRLVLSRNNAMPARGTKV